MNPRLHILYLYAWLFLETAAVSISVPAGPDSGLSTEVRLVGSGLFLVDIQLCVESLQVVFASLRDVSLYALLS